MAETRTWQARGKGYAADQVAGVQLLHLRTYRQGAASVSSAIDIELPTEPNVMAGHAIRTMWLAPEEWLIAHSGEISLGEWEATLQGRDILYLLNDVSDGYAVFDVSGEAARDVIAHGCSLDLHPSVFGADRCARTLFAGSQALIHGGPATFRLFVDPGLDWFVREWFAQHANAPLGSLP